MAAVEVLEPIYEQTDDVARLVEVQRIQLSHEKKPADARRAAAAHRPARRPASGTPTRPGRRTRGPSPRIPSTAQAREALENLATILDNWQPLVALYEKALSAKGKEKLPSALERELLLVVAVAYDEKLGAVGEGGRVLPPGAEHPARGRLGAGGARAALHAHRALERSRRHAAQEGAARLRAAEREEIRIRIATVWEEMLGNAEQAIVAWNVVLAGQPAQPPGAARRSTASICRAASTASSPTTCSAS